MTSRLCPDRGDHLLHDPRRAGKPLPAQQQRKRRIAAGTGTQVVDMNRLLKQFEMMQKMMKQFKKFRGRTHEAARRDARAEAEP